MPDNLASIPQPPPTPGTGPRIVDLVAGELEGNAYDVDKLVAADLRARAEVGVAKYGTYLRAGNGRDALADWYQEALDGLMYGRQFVVGDGCDTIASARAYRHSIDLVRSLRSMIRERDGR